MTEDVLLSFSAYYMFFIILLVGKQSKNQMPSVAHSLMKHPFFCVWWICRRMELVTLSKHKFTHSELCPGWKLGYSSSLVQGSVLYRFVSGCEMGCKYTAAVCMFRCGNALGGFWPCRKFSMLQQLPEACCSNFMGISLCSSLCWAHCWGFRLSCCSTWQLCGVWCWQNSQNVSSGSSFGILPSRCWVAGDGTGAAKSLSRVRHPVGPDVLVCFQWEIRFSLSEFLGASYPLLPHHALGVVLYLLLQV